MSLPNEIPVAPIIRKIENGTSGERKEKPSTRLQRLLEERANLAATQLETAELGRLTAEIERERRRLALRFWRTVTQVGRSVFVL